MHTFSRDDMDLFLSDDLYLIVEENIRELEKYPTGLPVPSHEEDAFRDVLDSDVLEPQLNGSYGEYVRLIGWLIGKPRIAIMHAHGGSDNGEWMLVDGSVELPLQPWIDAHDGEYSCIAVLSCNVASTTPRTSRSPLYLPDRSFALSRKYTDSSFTLVCPFLGEIDEYTVDDAIERLSAHDGQIVAELGSFNDAVQNANPNPDVKLVRVRGGNYEFRGPDSQRVTIVGKGSDGLLSVVWTGTIASSRRLPIDGNEFHDFEVVVAVLTAKRHTMATRVAHVLRDAIECSVFRP